MDSNNIKVSWKLQQFEEIEKNEYYEKLYKIDKKIKIDFHGNRDFYYLIKGIANELNEINESENNIEIIEKYIERNFGGLEIEIDIDLNFEFENFSNEILDFLKTKNHSKISSVQFFKEIYNFVCEKDENKDLLYLKIKDENIQKYDFIKNIITNINDYKSRYLLLEIKSSLAPLIYQNIKKNNEKKEIFFFEGSPFPKDNNNEYQFKKISEIQEHAGKEHLVILQNLNQIYAFLYDLFNMNYTIKDGKRYSRVCLGNFSDQLVYIHQNFRTIIMVDKKFIDKVDPPFLNRFEKIIISFDKLLDNSQKKLCEDILRDYLKLKEILNEINKKNKINYELKDLLIGCKKEDIIGLIYNYCNETNNEDKKTKEEEIKNKIFKKIVKLLPQDIIVNLPEENILKKTFYSQHFYYNLEEYIKDINNNDEKKISIIYTFSSISSTVNEIEDVDDSFIMISEIKSEIQLSNSIEGILNKNKYNNNKFIIVHFDNSNSKKFKFFNFFC